MAVFRYQAIDDRQAAVRGTVTADSPRQARELLRSRGLLTQSVSELPEVRRGTPRSWLGSRHATAWALTVHEIALLLRAGTPLLTAIDTVAEQHRGSYRAALMQVHERVAAGNSFSEALRQRPDVFDSLSVQLVEVGENAGTLADVLSQLAEFKQRMVQLKDQVVTALLYPSFVLCFGIIATLFLMTYVLPPLLESLEESLRTLPWPTRVVKAVSDLLLQHRLALGVTAAVTTCGALIAARTRMGRRWIDGMLLKLPLLGPMAVKQSMARMAMVVSTLIRGGVPLTQALELAARSTRNVVLCDALEACSEEIGAGRDLREALQRAAVFPPLVVQIFAVGQEAGELDGMLDQLATDYNRQVGAMSARLAALLEPVLIILLAAGIGFVLVATILPILEAGNVL